MIDPSGPLHSYAHVDGGFVVCAEEPHLPLNQEVHTAVNRAVLQRIPLTARRILDLGCGDGRLGQALKQRQPAAVVGVTCSRLEAEIARGVLDQVLLRDLNHFSREDFEPFDCVVCSHVLDYLPTPQRLLSALQPMLMPHGTLVVAVPNILHWRQRLRFLRGQFRYTDGGVLDRLHYRFFDVIGARALVRDAGYQIVSAHADGGFPGSRFLPFPRLWDGAALRCAPGLFGVQFVICAQLGEIRP